MILAFPGMQSLDAVGPFEVFATANSVVRHLGSPQHSDTLNADIDSYKVSLVSIGAGFVPTESGLCLGTTVFPDDDERIDTLIIPGGNGIHEARRDAEIVRSLRSAAVRSRRVASVCTGAFMLAEMGVVNGRRVATHWARAERLAAEFPKILVDPDALYVNDGKYWSSAGVTAGIDLALALVQADFGVEVAQVVARWLVMFLHRPGGQSQFAAPVWVPRAERSPIRAVQEHVEAHPGADHSVTAMAASAAMSVRQFARVFAKEVGQPPGQFVELVRTQAARSELEATTDTLDVIARRCGLGTSETLRRVFHRHVGVAPDSYRKRFGPNT